MYADAAQWAVGQFRMADRRWIYCFYRGNPRGTKGWKNRGMTRHGEGSCVTRVSFSRDEALVP